MRPPDRTGTFQGHGNPGPASVSTVARVLRERVQASLFIVPNDPNELAYADFAWEQPIGSDGFVASAFGYVSRVNESPDAPYPIRTARHIRWRSAAATRSSAPATGTSG